MITDAVDSALAYARLAQQKLRDLQTVSPADPAIALLAEKLFTRDGVEDARSKQLLAPGAWKY